MAEQGDHLRFYFVTWNVATKSPEQDLHQLLGIVHKEPKNLPDFYIVALQEVNAQLQNIVIDMFLEDPWTKFFKDTLKDHDYVKIRTQRLQGIVLSLFCLRKHLTHLRFIETQYTRTGFGGLWGNKGAVSVRLNVYGVSTCIVNTHLTPHDHQLANRISDYNVILKEHTFSVPDTSSIFYHDYVFWIGDLNFRLNGEDLTASAIDLLVKKDQLDLLLERDQLKAVMESGEAFAELTEEKITFPPTYKYEFASQEFDLKRRPSWTDRILYKVNADVYEDVRLAATQHSYDSHSNYVQSDHKPVTAKFDVIVRPKFEEHGVEFHPVTAWFVDEQNSVSYTLSGNAKPASGDWIGLFKDGFSSVDDYLVYEYVVRGKTALPGESDSPVDRIYFSDTALRDAGVYRLLYVTEQGGVVGILGISPPFPGHRRPV